MTEIVEYHEGGNPNITRKAPGKTTYEAITLERGIMYDMEFESVPTRYGVTVTNRAPLYH